MKQLYFITALFLLPVIAGAQNKSFKENKYKLELPEYWKHGSKVWKKLSDRLPEVCEELKDKDICGDNCNARYTVEFYMSPPVVEDYHSYVVSPNPAGKPPTDTWEFITYYHFECYLLLYDNKTEKLLTKVVVVDTSELWAVKNRVTLPGYSPPQPIAYSPRYLPINTQGPPVATYNAGAPVYVQRAQTPFTDITNNKYKPEPGEKDQLLVVDEKFKAI